jgi:hypothetical protein
MAGVDSNVSSVVVCFFFFFLHIHSFNYNFAVNLYGLSEQNCLTTLECCINWLQEHIEGTRTLVVGLVKFYMPQINSMILLFDLNCLCRSL